MSAQGKPLRCEIIHDNFQNYKKYNVPKAQLVIADIPYNIGADAYGSNPMWYKGGDNANGESKYAKKSFFNSDGYFKIAEYMHFCSRLLRPEPGKRVLATDGVFVGEAYRTSADTWRRYDGIAMRDCLGSIVTHWMPLPLSAGRAK